MRPLLIAVKKGQVDALIPLYAIGVFSGLYAVAERAWSCTGSDLRQPGWQVKAAINGVGAAATFLVLMDIAYEKFTEGAWIVIVLIALLVLMFRKIHSHYLDVAQQLKLANYEAPDTPLKNTVLVLIPALHRGVMPALEYARSLSPDCRAVHICTDPERIPQLRERWEQWGHDVPLVILNSPYRSLLGPIMRYLDAVQHERRNHTVTVVVPEFVPYRMVACPAAWAIRPAAETGPAQSARRGRCERALLSAAFGNAAAFRRSGRRGRRLPAQADTMATE